MLATLTPASSNAKLTASPRKRPVSATRAAEASCPKDCALTAVCYGKTGPISWHWKKLESADPLAIAIAEADAILAEWPRDGRPLRIHEVGDATTDECAQTLASAVDWAQHDGAGPAWSYTHAWRSVDRASWGPVSILASCETDTDVDVAAARGYAQARVVAEFESPRRDSRGIPCPAQTGAAADCASCGLCMRADRLRRPILFETHGARKRAAADIVSA